MLVELRVENFALIDQVLIRFGPGFNAFTGETGAGKSIVVDAMETVLGGRVSSDLIREGAERATVEAVFDIQAQLAVKEELQEMGLGDGQDRLLVVTREIATAGRSVIRLNRRVVNASAARRITRLLVDLHGQHEHQALLEPDRPLELLDAFGGVRAAELVRKVALLWRERLDCERSIESLTAGLRDRARQIDLIQHQVTEIETAGLVPGEDEALEDEQRRLIQFEKLIKGADLAYRLIYGGQEDPAAADLIARASEELGRLALVDPSLEPYSQSLDEALIQINEVSRELASYRERLEADPGRLEQIEDRLALIRDLKRKYGATIPEVLTFRDQISTELGQLEGSDQRLEELKNRFVSIDSALEATAKELTGLRRRSAALLTESVTRELQELNLSGATLKFHLEPRDGGEITAQGADRCVILFSANRGETPRPLGRVASGGELSRVMLGLKTVLAGLDEVGIMIFDEIDTGLGGRTAVAVGEKMAALSSERQVIAVTHLPQIAAMANPHFLVQKIESGGRTMVRVVELPEEERCTELARMMGGEDLSPLAREHARDLIRQGRSARENSA